MYNFLIHLPIFFPTAVPPVLAILPALPATAPENENKCGISAIRLVATEMREREKSEKEGGKNEGTRRKRKRERKRKRSAVGGGKLKQFVKPSRPAFTFVQEFANCKIPDVTDVDKRDGERMVGQRWHAKKKKTRGRADARRRHRIADDTK